MAISQCSGCGEIFNSNGAFDAHRVGGHPLSKHGRIRRCLTPDEMLTAGWQKNARGRWIVEEYDGPERLPTDASLRSALRNSRRSDYNSPTKF